MNITEKKVAFFGTGNMGGALAAAVSETTKNLLLVDCNQQAANAAAEKTGGKVSDAQTAAESADFIFLGVKPQVMPSLLASLSPLLSHRKTPFVLVSMAAGLSIETLESLLGFSTPIIRIMPNTPVQVGKGVILTACKGVSEEDKDVFFSLLAKAGVCDEIPEALIDAGTSLSGCGPAYVALFVEGLADGAVACGLPRERALAYAVETILGTATLLKEEKLQPSVLKDRVCSPGGSTIAGVRALENGGFRGLAMQAVLDAFARNKELGKSK